MNTARLLLPMAVAVAAALLVGCAAGPEPRAGAPAAEWPDFKPAGDGERVYVIDEAASVLLARVDPAGPMARLGHSHVVGGAVLGGRIIVGGSKPRAEVRVHAHRFEVDRPEWRRAHGLEPALDPDAIEGTRANLLGPDVLAAASHPTLDVRTVDVQGPEWLPEVTLRVRWRGRVREYGVPVAVAGVRAALEITGRIELRHADFGLQPFSAAGGALRVSDRIEVRFRIVAAAAGPDVDIIAGQPDPRENNP